ncbi:MAG: hypothetical protein J6X40_06445 [Bacteroidales bacterium]|nr:hypothetical protein [Bacteroidales bacterium]
MKTMKWTLVLATLTLAAVSCGPKKTTQNVEEKTAPKLLVLYYSQSANTQAVAMEIATRLGADIEEILPVIPYDGDFQATVERGKKELDEAAYPEIRPLAKNPADYDVIFLGYPIWFGTFAPPVFTFLNQVDLSGKKIVPFCTFGSGGLESSLKDLAALEPEAELLPGYGVRAARLDAMPQEIEWFLKANGFIEGEYAKLEAFPEQHSVTDEEAAIFNTAVGDYPMIHAQAKTVASRNIPDGMEYEFVAADLPREDRPDLPPAGEITVYVKVTGAETPVFTKVIR